MRNLGTPVTNVEQMGALAARSKFAAPVQEYKQALEIQKEIIALEQQLANKKEADDQHARRVKDARAVLDIEMKIAREQARGGKDDSATINKFRDELNVIQLTAQVQDQLKVSQAEALKIAVQKVSAERAAADAIKAQAEAERKKSQLYNPQELAAQLRAEALRAAGRDKEAAALERRIRVVNEAKRIESATGLDPARAMQIAERREKTRARDDFRQGMTGSSSLYNADGSKTGRRINARIEGGWEDSRERARQRLLQNETRRREALASRGPAGMNEFWALQRGEVGQLPGASRLGEAAFGVRQAQNDSRTAPAPTVALSAREMEVLIAIKDGILKLAP